ncbi:MAG: SDR family NAD(P)-dependent oxidoreductase [Candidatus Pacebacteria bacterium]|nr:SDR family NAD(P)-dependent oxidoreductase [Candidatus Paceibacterota bacterium]
MTILVTGAAGFIGFHTCSRLLSENISVIGIDSFDPYYSLAIKHAHIDALKKSSLFSFYLCDIRSKEFSSLIRQTKPDIIIHLAAKAGVRNSFLYPFEYFDVNVHGTMLVLQAAKTASIPRVLIASSSSVYGTNKKIPFHENDVVEHQVSPYAASKRAMEIVTKSFAKSTGIHVQLFRFFTVYGPSGRPDMAPYLFTKAIDAEQPLTIFGDMTTKRDYTYIDDITEGLLSATKRDDVFEIYNLGNNKPVTLKTFIHTIEKVVGKKAKLHRVPKQKGDVPYTWADISKAQKFLRFSPQTSLFNGLTKFYSWYKTNSHFYTTQLD